MPSEPNYWLKHAPQIRERPPGIDWDVFISYRSTDRLWALSLHDMLRQAGWQVFVDQFALLPGDGLQSELSKHLTASASGVLLWSSGAASSRWVGSEMDAMTARAAGDAGSAFPFHFVTCRLDATPPPALLGGKLYLDFQEYPDGPTGAELVRLTHALCGKPMPEHAVAEIAKFEQVVRAEPTKLRARRAAGDFDDIKARALAETTPYTTSATLPSLAAQCLIEGKRYDDALEVLDAARQRFAASIRLRQLRGLVLRRKGRTLDAKIELGELYEAGHRDPETMGILAAAWTDSAESSGDKIDLEKAHSLYAEAWRLTPTDTYVGINAAAKAAMLGDHDLAASIAREVAAVLASERKARGGAPDPDYWKRVTEPEALFILGECEDAATLYRAAIVAHSTEHGSIESTAKQVGRLAAVLPHHQADIARVVATFDAHSAAQS